MCPYARKIEVAMETEEGHMSQPVGEGGRGVIRGQLPEGGHV